MQRIWTPFFFLRTRSHFSRSAFDASDKITKVYNFYWHSLNTQCLDVMTENMLLFVHFIDIPTTLSVTEFCTRQYYILSNWSNFSPIQMCENQGSIFCFINNYFVIEHMIVNEARESNVYVYVWTENVTQNGTCFHSMRTKEKWKNQHVTNTWKSIQTC